MNIEQTFLLLLLGTVLVLFIWGRWRYDVVAFAALIATVLSGIIPATDAFEGFGHPATITVAMVLIISRGLQNSGAVDLIARHVLLPVKNPEGHIGILSVVSGSLSAIMNNVGALALLMPAALQLAKKEKRPAALILMPLSFASILGGLVTLIGTPPNIIIATFRGDLTGQAFSMFDFTPVGGTVAVAGILFISLIGWQLIPTPTKEKLSPGERFDIQSYVTEAKVGKESSIVGRTLAELNEEAAKHDAVLLALIRRGSRITKRRTEVKSGDFLIIEVAPESLNALLRIMDVTSSDAQKKHGHLLDSDDTALSEALVAPSSRVIGQTGEALRLRRRFGVNLLGVYRQGRSFRGRLNSFRFKTGDVLLLEGDPDRLFEVIAALGCLPLAERGLQPPRHEFLWISIAIFAAAIAATTLNLISLPIALALAVGVMVIIGVVPPRDIYDNIDWPVIVLLGAMIPIGQALEITGTTDMIAAILLQVSVNSSPVFALVLVMVLTMTLSDIMNNAATAVVMAPVSASLAQQLDVAVDPFLMAVAIGASCAFLTPIGHQNNALIMGPGGFRFGDYWRLGLPLEIIIIVVAIPMLLWVWPL